MDKKDECLKILKNLFFNEEGSIVDYIDFTSSYGDEWNGYTLEQYVKAFIDLKDEINRDKVLNTRKEKRRHIKNRQFIIRIYNFHRQRI